MHVFGAYDQSICNILQKFPFEIPSPFILLETSKILSSGQGSSMLFLEGGECVCVREERVIPILFSLRVFQSPALYRWWCQHYLPQPWAPLTDNNVCNLKHSSLANELLVAAGVCLPPAFHSFLQKHSLKPQRGEELICPLPFFIPTFFPFVLPLYFSEKKIEQERKGWGCFIVISFQGVLSLHSLVLIVSWTKIQCWM